MKKTLLIILTLGLFVFIGYWVTEMCQFADGVKNDAIQVETIFRYEPEEHLEESIDTLLDKENNVRLILKRYSLDSGFEVPFENGNTIETVFFRDFAVDLKLMIDDSLITETKFQKDDFKSKIDDTDFLQMAYLSFVDFEDFDSENQEVKLAIMLIMIETDYAYIFEVKHNKQGQSTITLKETT